MGGRHGLETIRCRRHRSIVCSLTDWFFAGDWLHRRYTYPEIWREGAEGRAIALTSPLPFLTCGVFAYVIARLSLRSVGSAVKLAFAVWLLGPLPLILTNAAFMKLHRAFVVWLANCRFTSHRERNIVTRALQGLPLARRSFRARPGKADMFNRR